MVQLENVWFPNYGVDLDLCHPPKHTQTHTRPLILSASPYQVLKDNNSFVFPIEHLDEDSTSDFSVNLNYQIKTLSALT